MVSGETAKGGPKRKRPSTRNGSIGGEATQKNLLLDMKRMGGRFGGKERALPNGICQIRRRERGKEKTEISGA